ncbi:peptidyl-prolyl cis-trans isomerase [Candidatus Woesearchaeota archaeon]|nr:peptidyl-prolyl cis-trans isomerase [Candidatus Woesearchaeota archaeon]
MPKQIRASHILVEKEVFCKELIQKLKNGANFEELARQFSKCPSGKKSGGDLGFFGKGQMVPQFENAAMRLKVGEISGPVRTQFGFHIIKKTDER